MAKKSKASKKRRKNLAKKNRNKRNKFVESIAYEALEPRQLLAVTTLPFVSVGAFDQFSGGEPARFGFGVEGITGVDPEPEFVGFEFDETITVGSIGENIFGEFGGQGRADVEGKIGIEYGYFISGGIGSIVSEGDFQYEIVAPTTDEFFTLTTDTLVDESRLQTISPTISVYADLVFELDASVAGVGCFGDCVGDLNDPIQIINIEGEDSRIELLALNRQSGVENGNPVFDGEFRVFDLGLGGEEEDEEDMAAATAAQQAREDLLAAQNDEARARSDLNNASTAEQRRTASEALQNATTRAADADSRNTAARDRLAADSGDRNVDADGDPSSAGFGLNIGPAEGGLLGVTATVGPEFQSGALGVSQEFGSLTLTLPEVNLSDTTTGEGTLIASTEDGVFDKDNSDIARVELNVGTILSSYFPGLGTTSFSFEPVSASVTTVEYTLGAGLDVTQDFQAEFSRDIVTVTFDEDVTVQNTANLLPRLPGENQNRTFRFVQGTDIKFKPVNPNAGAVAVDFSLDREYSIDNDIGLQLGLDGTLTALAASLGVEVGPINVPILDIGPVFQDTHELASFDIPAFSFDYLALSEAEFNPVTINLSPDVTVVVENQSSVIFDDSISTVDGEFNFDAVITNDGLANATGVGLNLSDLNLRNNDLQIARAVDSQGNSIDLNSLTLEIIDVNNAELTGLGTLALGESIRVTFTGETATDGGTNVQYTANLEATADVDVDLTDDGDAATNISVRESLRFIVNTGEDVNNQFTILNNPDFCTESGGGVCSLRDAVFTATFTDLEVPAEIFIAVPVVNLNGPIRTFAGDLPFRIVGQGSERTRISSPLGLEGGAFDFAGDPGSEPYLLTGITLAGETGGSEDTSSAVGDPLLRVVDTEIILDDVVIKGHTNTSTADAGAIGALRSDVTIRNSVITENEAFAGGGIQAVAGSLLVENSVFSNNSAEVIGGAISVAANGLGSEATVTIVDSLLAGNIAGRGAAIFSGRNSGANDDRISNTISLVDVRVTDNVATGVGAGVIQSGTFGNQEDVVTAERLVIFGNEGDNFSNITFNESFAGLAAELGASDIIENITSPSVGTLNRLDENTDGGITYEFVFTARNINPGSNTLLASRFDGTGALTLERSSNLSFATFGVTVDGIDFTSTVNVDENRRTHVAFVADGTDLLLYKNGLLADTFVGASLNLSGNVTFGQRNDVDNFFTVVDELDGTIHGFAIHDRALSPAEIARSRSASRSDDGSLLNVSDDNSLEFGPEAENGLQSQNVDSLVRVERSSSLVDSDETSPQAVILANVPGAEIGRVFWTLPGREIVSNVSLNPSFTFNDDGVLVGVGNAFSRPGDDFSFNIQGTDTEGNTFVESINVTVIAAPTAPANVNAGVSVVNLDGPQPDFVVDDGEGDLFTVNNFATINWDFVADTEYIVRAFTVGDAEVDNRLLVIGANSQSGLKGEARFTNLSASTQYQFSVEARNLIGNTDPVESAVLITHRPPPTQVQIVSAEENPDNSQIVVTWRPSLDLGVDGDPDTLNQLADGYRVIVNGVTQPETFFFDDRGEPCSTPGEGLCTVSAFTAADADQETDPDFLYNFILFDTDPDTEYEIQIQAVNAAGTQTARVTVETDLLAPEVPENVSARAISPTRALIEWDTSDNATEYIIVGQTSGGEMTRFLADTTIAQGTERVVVDGLEPGENYTFFVIAGNEDHGVPSLPVSAQTINETPGLLVTTTDDVVDPDDFQTSLREAINFANTTFDADGNGLALDRIRFDVDGVFLQDAANPQTIQLSAELQVTDSLIISGETGIQLSGQDENRVFYATGNRIDLSLQDLVLQNGRSTVNASSAGFEGQGGAILFDSDGVLELVDSTVENSTASSTVTSNNVSGGAIHSTGNVNLTRTAIVGNTATGNNPQGGGVYSAQGIIANNSFINSNSLNATGSDGQPLLAGASARGGGLYAVGTISLNDSTVSINRILSNAIGGGGVYSSGRVNLRGSVIHYNQSFGPNSQGGGVFAASVDSVQSTISNNLTQGPNAKGGGIATGQAFLTTTTVADNFAFGSDTNNQGGGVFAIATELNSSTLTGNRTQGSGAGVHTNNSVVTNSIILGNFANNGANEIESVGSGNSMTLVGSSIIGGGVDPVNPDDVFADTNPLGGSSYGVLGVNGAVGLVGGPVETIVRTVALKFDPENPALDLNSSSTVQVDARGNPRAVDFPGNSGGFVDAGAFESSNLVIVNSIEDSADLVGATTLREAINFTNSTDLFNEIQFADQLSDQTIRLNGELPVITRGLTIDASGLEERLDIFAGYLSRHITFDSPGLLTLDSLRLRGGFVQGDVENFDETFSGGSIRLTAGEGSGLELINTRIESSATGGNGASGGAIFAKGIDVTLTNSELFNNSTNGENAKGGAIYAKTVSFTGSNVVYGNQTLYDNSPGGAIFASESFSTGTESIESFQGTSFLNNSTDGNNSPGGAVYTGTAVIGQALFERNSTSASNSGGGALVITTGAEIAETHFESNRTEGFISPGGAIHHRQSDNSTPFTVAASSFIDNATLGAASPGGAIFAEREAFRTEAISVIGNSTSGLNSGGGGIATAYSGTTSGTKLYIQQATIAQNSTAGSGSRGGGVATGTLYSSFSTITGNSTNSQILNLSPGGGVSVSDRADLTNSLILGNYSRNSSSNELQIFSGGTLSLTGLNLVGSDPNDFAPQSDTVNGGSTLNANPEDVFALISTTNVDFLNNDGITETPSLVVGGVATDNGGRRLTVALNPDITTNIGLDAGIDGELELDVFDLDNDGITDEPVPLDANFANRVVGLGASFARSIGGRVVESTDVDLGALELPTLIQETQSLVVTTTDDSEYPNDGLTSLREAIAFADSGDADGINGNLDRITFDPSLAGETIQLDGVSLAITQSLIIDASNIGGITIDAFQRSRIIHFEGSTGDLTLNGLTLTSGRTDFADRTVGAGGGIRFESAGTLILESSRLVDNQTRVFEAGGGGIYAVGNVVLNSSVLDNNRTLLGSSPGGAVLSLGNVTISSSTLSNNYTTDSESSGGAVSTRRLEVTNATIVQNSVAGNQSIGGGLHAEVGSTISNSIILDNSSAFDPASSEINRDSALSLSGGNIIGESSFTFDTDGTPAINASFEDVFADAELTDNGGSLPSFALLPSTDNPALDGGRLANVSQTTDGRGLPRSVDLPGITGDTPVDLGAYELQTGVQELPSLFVTTDSDVVDAFDFATSLREAVAFANDTTAGSQNDGDADEDGFIHDTITFSESLRGETITLGADDFNAGTRGELRLTSSATIAGLGADQLTISGNNDSRILNFAANGAAEFTVSDVTLTGGVVPRGSQANPEVGGAILLSTGNNKLTIERSVISNSAANGGGAIFFGGNGSELDIVDSALIDNIANYSGSALLTYGSTTTTIVNSTISGNESINNFGAILQQTAGSDVAAMEIRNSTIANNTGFGIFNSAATNASTITLGNTILADNTRPSIAGSGTITSLGNNLADDGSPFLNGPDDQTSVDPLLSPLALNGGTTPTHALGFNSPAIGGGSNLIALDAEDNPLTSDQAGRRRIFDSTVDIGAFESDFDDTPILLGDADLNGVVDFADIPAFIDVLINGNFLDEADVDRSGVVDFADIPAFIDVLINVGSSTSTSQSVVLAPPVSSAASLVSVSQPVAEPEPIASVAATVEVPLTTQTSNAIEGPTELVEYDSIEKVEATDPTEIVASTKKVPDQVAATESKSVEASQFSTAASLPSIVAPQFNSSTSNLPIAPVVASAVEDRLPRGQAISSSTPLSLVGGVDGSESRANDRQLFGTDFDSDQQETEVEDLLDETFSTYEEDLEIVFS